MRYNSPPPDRKLSSWRFKYRWFCGKTTSTSLLFDYSYRNVDIPPRLMGATKSFISKFANPWEQLTFHYTGTQGKVFNAHEDRYFCFGVCFFLNSVFLVKGWGLW